MNSIPRYPEFAPISLEMARELSPHLVSLPDGVSEFSFAGLYLFRNRYDYRVSMKGEFLIVSGERAGIRFFVTPCCSTGMDTVTELFKTHEKWKLISPAFLAQNRTAIEAAGYAIEEDRDNWDYLYLRNELATLSGKKFHKKKNHVNAFELTYPGFSVKPLDVSTRDGARAVLDSWVSHESDPDNTDYRAACEALDLLDQFAMSGLVLYVDDIPVAWTLAETVAGGRISAVHFEKALTEFRGAYQYINYAFAQALPESVEFVNREQDLGDEGMRQAKMTYRPVGFVEKYKVIKTI
jgi:uncharacterized protein